MEHSMGLYEAPFNSMKARRKTVEVRLNDPKRRKIDIGETINFTKLPEDGETLTVESRYRNEFITGAMGHFYIYLAEELPHAT